MKQQFTICKLTSLCEESRSYTHLTRLPLPRTLGEYPSTYMSKDLHKHTARWIRVIPIWNSTRDELSCTIAYVAFTTSSPSTPVSYQVGNAIKDPGLASTAMVFILCTQVSKQVQYVLFDVQAHRAKA